MTSAVDVVKSGSRGSVMRLELPTRLGREQMYLKERILRNPWIVGLRYLGWSRMWCAVRGTVSLRKHGIRTPRVLAAVSMFHGPEIREYMLTESIPHSVCLHDLLAEEYPEWPTSEQRLCRSILFRSMGDLIGRLHAAAYDHRDLKGSNFVTGTGQSHSTELHLIDLEGLRRWPVLPLSRRRQNLSRLLLSAESHQLASRTDCLRFLKAYLSSEFDAQWKGLWRGVERITLARRATMIRQGRPLH